MQNEFKILANDGVCVSNQRVINISKEKCDKDNIYMTTNKNAMQNASRILNGHAFKLWIYLSSNVDGHRFNLSSKHFIETMGGSQRNYLRAFKELVDNGFITIKDYENNEFIFNELPQIGSSES